MHWSMCREKKILASEKVENQGDFFLRILDTRGIKHHPPFVNIYFRKHVKDTPVAEEKARGG